MEAIYAPIRKIHSEKGSLLIQPEQCEQERKRRAGRIPSWNKQKWQKKKKRASIIDTDHFIVIITRIA